MTTKQIENRKYDLTIEEIREWCSKNTMLSYVDGLVNVDIKGKRYSLKGIKRALITNTGVNAL